MRILLSTYNYYPLHQGGTEVYVSRMVREEINKGNEVLIIAASDKNKLNSKGIETTPVFQSKGFEAFFYSWEGVPVLGVSIVEENMLWVHQKWTASFEQAFAIVLEKIDWNKPDVFWMHGFNGVSGISLMHALLNYHTSLYIKVWLHTPFTCYKGTLTTSDYTTCTLNPSIDTCKECYLKTRLGLIGSLAKSMKTLFQVINFGLPHSFQKLDTYIKLHYNSVIKLIEHVNEWVCFTDTMLPHLENLAIPRKKITIERHSIDTQLFHSQDRTNTYIKRFMFNGRFLKIKGFQILAAAWLNLPDEPSKRVLTLVGDYENVSKNINYFIQKLKKRKDVRFISVIDQNRMASLYREQDIVIIPSLWVETGPLVFHEAVACGCKVIASEIGGNSSLHEFYPNDSFTYTPNSVSELYECIQHSAISNPSTN